MNEYFLTQEYRNEIGFWQLRWERTMCNNISLNYVFIVLYFPPHSLCTTRFLWQKVSPTQSIFSYVKWNIKDNNQQFSGHGKQVKEIIKENLFFRSSYFIRHYMSRETLELCLLLRNSFINGIAIRAAIH